MIPNIFISSTIQDLHYLRDAVRDTILELGYNPIMSEHGDFGYHPSMTIEDSCYNAMKDSQIAIIIISKRYGSKSSNNLSVTHNEFQTARNYKIPVLCLIDKEVLSFKKIYEAKKKPKDELFPEMDSPSDTFEFINEFIESPVNNGYRPFETVNDVRENIKKQIAHMFGNFLREKTDTLKSGINDIISEIKTLRHEISPEKASKENFRFLRTTRLLIDQKNMILGNLLTMINNDNIDEAIINFIESRTLEENILKAGVSYLTVDVDDIMRSNNIRKNFPGVSSVKDMVPFEIAQKYTNEFLSWGFDKETNKILINPLTKEYLEYLFQKIKAETESH